MQTPLKSDKFRFRYYFSVAFLVFIFIPIFFQIYHLQVGDRERFQKMAEKQHYVAIDIMPERGEIFDRNRKILATSLNVPSLYAVSRLIPKEEKSSLAKKLSDILSLSEPFILSKLKRNKSFVWIKRKLTEEEAEQIRGLEHPRLGFINEPKRFYPAGETFANLIGICDIDDRGIEGLELYYNRYLSGQKGMKVTKRDAIGRTIAALDEKYYPPVNGHNLVLNIDQFIQHVAERELKKSFNKWNAKGASCVVLEPKTGQILAMVSLPGFDPNHLDERFAIGKRNRSIVDYYEPGSIFKMVTLAAAFEYNTAWEDEIIYCENGQYQFTRSRVLNDTHPYGDLTFRDVIVFSSNIGTVKVAEKMGEKPLYEMIKRFGFGDLTGVDFPGEVSGVIRPVKRWSGYSISSIPMGQEVTVTSLQMATAMAAVANGGVLVKPYLVSEIIDDKGVRIKAFKPEIRKRVISEKTASRVKDVLKDVVVYGTGRNAQVEGIATAGKTGTAQKILKNGKGYSHSDFIGSWVGFAPVEDPQIVINVMMDEPRPAYYGGTVSAPVFREIVKEVLYYLGMPVGK